nr:RraA family protein [Maliibacterium massiliense]
MNGQINHEQEVLKELERFDTPSITNVVASYPADGELCLGLYHPWEGNWYADARLRCIYPELGARAGHVVTVVYGMPDETYQRLSFADLLEAIAAAPKPVILAVKQNLPARVKCRCGLVGGNMMTAFKSLGVTGVLSDGPSRDVDEIRPMGMQYLLTGVTCGHGNFAIEAIDVPVDICGMHVAPGEIVHMDENGACKFPRARLDDVLARVSKLRRVEAARQEKMRATSDPAEIAKIMKGFYD